MLIEAELELSRKGLEIRAVKCYECATVIKLLVCVLVVYLTMMSAHWVRGVYEGVVLLIYLC